MACRIGMSTNPKERIEHWKRVEGHTGGEILHSGLTYDEATVKERDEAQSRRCAHQGGGERKPGAVYSVYHVWGGTISSN